MWVAGDARLQVARQDLEPRGRGGYRRALWAGEVLDGEDAQPPSAGRGAAQWELPRAVARRAGGCDRVRLQLIAAALDLGLLDAVGGGPASTEQLTERLGVVDHDLLAAYLRVL